ncbi:hypothetical protein [Crenothrix sp.]|uniref:hypothetical protein n=1 Tax=Crenothrix sp. TaxID=3100433 RepID=UPI00374CF28E
MIDVYISGINPQQIGNLEDIKKNVDLQLGIKGLQLESLLNPIVNLICVKKNVSENEAIKFCEALTKLGLLSTYQPTKTKQSSGLSLVPLEEKETFFTCPSCNKKQVLDDNEEIKLCPFCAVDVKKHLKDMQEKEEYQEIRKKILLKSQHQIDFEKQEHFKKEELKRKAQIEAKIAKELGQQPEPGWQQSLVLAIRQTKKIYWVGFSVLATGLTAGTIYYSLENQSINNTLIVNIPEMAAIPEQNIIVLTAGELPTQDEIINISPVPNAQEVIVISAGTSASSAFKKRHAHVTALNSFMKTSAKSVVVKGSASVLMENRLFLESIYTDLTSDVEWDAYLNKEAIDNIHAGKLKAAYILSQYQTNLTDHITVINELLKAFSKLNRTDLMDSTVNKLNERIHAQPIQQQAVLKAQLASGFQDMVKQKIVLNEAESLAFSLVDPVKQSQAFSGIALSQKTEGKPDSGASDKFLSFAEERLKVAKIDFEKFSGYINLAHDYTKLGLNVRAENAINQAENLLTQFDATQQDQGLAMLLNAAYLTDDSALPEKYVTRIKASVYSSKALYQNIQIRLKENWEGDVTKQLANIKDPDFAAVATALATFIKSVSINQSLLVSTAQLQLTTIQHTENKAIATSKVARYFFRLGNDKEALLLFDHALETARSMPEGEQKDAVLIVLATDSARVFLNDRAEQIASLIDDNSLKTATLDTIKMTQEVKDALAN